MSEFLSFLGVIALWVAVSALAWLVHQRRNGSRQQQRIIMARAAADRVAEAQAVFDHIRRNLPKNIPLGDLGPQTHALLKRIQQRGEFFDAVNGLRPQLTRLFGEECEPLAEILHIRRDLWAASEIVLIEDFRKLGPDFADEEAYARLRGEAVHVLLPDAARVFAPHDLIDLRLSLARDEATQFVADTDEAIRLAREHERLPTASELIAYPVAAARALPGQMLSARDQAVSFYDQVRAVAVMIRQSESVVKGLGELRRARAELPQRVVAGLGRTSAAARQSATSLKGHYDFLIAAYDFQAKYEELVRKAPELTERGKQFIARLELAEKSERLKLTSATVRDWSKRTALWSLANTIAALQHALAALERRLAAADTAAGSVAVQTTMTGSNSTRASKTGNASQPRKGNASNGNTPSAMRGAATAAVSSRGKAASVAQPSPPPANREREERGPALGSMHRLKGTRPKEPIAAAAANPLPKLTLKLLTEDEATPAPDAVRPSRAGGESDHAAGKAGNAAGPVAEGRPLKLQTPPPAASVKLTLKEPPHEETAQSSRSAPSKAAATQSPAASTPDVRDVAPTRQAKGWRLFGGRAKPEKTALSSLHAAEPPKVAKERTRQRAELKAPPPAARSEGQTPPPQRAGVASEPATPPQQQRAAPAKRSWFGRTPKAAKPDASVQSPRSTAVAPPPPPVMPAQSKSASPARVEKPAPQEAKAAASAMVAPVRTPPPQTPPKRGWFGVSRPAKIAGPGDRGKAAPSSSVTEPPLSRVRLPAVEEAKPATSVPMPATTPAAAAPQRATPVSLERDKAPPKKSMFRGWSRSRTQTGNGEPVAKPTAQAQPNINPSASSGLEVASAAINGQASPKSKLASPAVTPPLESKGPATSRLWSNRSYQQANPSAVDTPLMPKTARSEGSPAPARKEATAQGDAFKLPPLKLIGDAETGGGASEPPAAAKTPEPTPSAAKPAPGAGRKLSSLSAKLTAAATHPDSDDPEPAAEPDTAGGEDDDPGPLTQTILQSRDRESEEPGRGFSRAFPWLRR
jgi:hypothetical protein